MPLLKHVFLVAVLILCSAAAPAPSPAPRADRAEIFEYGLYQRGKVLSHEDATAEHFGRVQVDGWKHLRMTQKVPAALGTGFGFQYRVIGQPPGQVVPIFEATLLPPPGAKPPLGARPITRDYSDFFVRIGDENRWMFSFDFPWEMVPGIWTIQIWSGEKKIGEQQFEVFVPPSV